METMQSLRTQLQGQLIVSCQALDNEPLHSSFIMGRMAIAARDGGAKGIRANSISDIREIKKVVDLPIIGIIKRVFEGNDVFITPTMEEIDALVEEGVAIVALDATKRVRPDGKTITEVFPEIRAKYPTQLFMADCSNFEEAKEADRLGFDFLGTTLNGYTAYTKGTDLPNVNLISKMVHELKTPVIAEGGIWTPEQLSSALKAGALTAVVGTAITRPKEITERFVRAISNT